MPKEVKTFLQVWGYPVYTSIMASSELLDFVQTEAFNTVNLFCPLQGQLVAEEIKNLSHDHTEK